jgi:hypothetical protein
MDNAKNGSTLDKVPAKIYCISWSCHGILEDQKADEHCQQNSLLSQAIELSKHGFCWS